jgi:hypothetical protein
LRPVINRSLRNDCPLNKTRGQSPGFSIRNRRIRTRSFLPSSWTWRTWRLCGEFGTLMDSPICRDGAGWLTGLLTCSGPDAATWGLSQIAQPLALVGSRGCLTKRRDCPRVFSIHSRLIRTRRFLPGSWTWRTWRLCGEFGTLIDSPI